MKALVYLGCICVVFGTAKVSCLSILVWGLCYTFVTYCAGSRKPFCVGHS